MMVIHDDWWLYPLVMTNSLLLEMAIYNGFTQLENGDFS